MLRTRVRAGPVAGLLMSLVFACSMTIVHSGDRFVPALAPRLGAPSPVTVRLPSLPRITRDPGTNRVQVDYAHSSRVLVPRGTELSSKNDVHQIAVSVSEQVRTPNALRLTGVFVIFFTLCLAITSYLRRFGQNRLRLVRMQVGLLTAVLLLTVVAKVLLLGTSLPEYWIPIATIPLWVATSFDRRTGFVVTVMLTLAVGSLLQFDPLLLAVLLSRGMAATLYYLDRKHKRAMVVSGVFAGVSAACVYMAIRTAFEGHFELLLDLAAGDRSDVLACIGGGLSAGLIGALLRSPAERLLGHVPRDRLLDLTDLEQPLLLKLAQDAPGTWEHSRAMANLAEQAASAIGADALLTRVGAYYHDVGKTAQAKYFVENLGHDERSPHDDLDPEVSADAIMSHVVIGAQLLRSGNVPESVVEFAYTHHGTQLVEYFWNRCKEQGNPKDLPESAFRYPGMKPQTKETAILMLVDSIEAASRTIDPPGREQFDAMIQRVLFTKLASGQLDESGLDVTDLRVVANRMTDTLVNMHHHRIKYPWQAKRAEEFGVPSRAVRESERAIPVAAPPATEPPPSVIVVATESLPAGASNPLDDTWLSEAPGKKE